MRLPVYTMTGHGCVKVGGGRMVTLKKDQYVVFPLRMGTGSINLNSNNFVNKFKKNQKFRTNVRMYLMGNASLGSHRYLKIPHAILEVYGPGEKMDNHILQMFEPNNAPNRTNNYTMGVMKENTKGTVTSVIKRTNRKNLNVTTIMGAKKGIFIYLGCRYNEHMRHTKTHMNETLRLPMSRGAPIFGKKVYGNPNNFGFVTPSQYAKLEGPMGKRSLKPYLARSYLRQVREITGHKKGGKRTTTYVKTGGVTKGRRTSRGPGGIYAPLARYYRVKPEGSGQGRNA